MSLYHVLPYIYRNYYFYSGYFNVINPVFNNLFLSNYKPSTYSSLFKEIVFPDYYIDTRHFLSIDYLIYY